MSLLGPPGPPPPDGLVPSWRRLAAFMIDVLIISAVLSPLLVPSLFAQLQHSDAVRGAVAAPREVDVGALPFWARGWFLAVVTAVVFAAYRIPQVALFGRTLGHRLLELRVIGHDGGTRVGWKRAGLRYVIFYGVDAIPAVGPVFSVVNYLWCVFDRTYRQCLHDKVAGTFVVEAHRRPAAARQDAAQPAFNG